MRRVQKAIHAAAPTMQVELAFLAFMPPDLPTCAAEAIAAGARRVVVLPMFIAQGGHLKREVPEMLAALRARWPAVEFVLDRAIGEEEAVIQAMAAAALKKAGAAVAGQS